MNWLDKIFPPKFYLAPPGYDPTVDPLPDGWNSRRAGGGGWGLALGLALALLAMGGLVYGSWWMWTRPARERAAANQPTEIIVAALGALPDERPTLRPTRTPLVFPTVGVVSATPGRGSSSSPTPVVFPTLEGGPIGPTTTPPWMPTATQARNPDNGSGGSVAAAPLPTYTALPPLPTYTPYPTYTAVAALPTLTATASPTVTPTATATCAPTATLEPTATETATDAPTAEVTDEPATPEPTAELAALTSGELRLYLPLVLVSAEGGGC